MLQALIGPVSGLIGSWMDSKTEEQRGKSAVAKAKAEADGEGQSNVLEGRVAYDSV